MPSGTVVLRDRRGSPRNIHVGQVSVFRRAASWCIYYRENGKPRKFRIGPDRREAEQRAAEINAQLAHGLPSTFGYERVSVEELVRLWLEHHELVLRSSVATVRRYRAATEHLLHFTRGTHIGLMADCVTPRIAESFVKHLRGLVVSPNGHSKTPKRKLRDKGLIYILEVCRSLFNYVIRQRHLPPYAHNPFAELGIERMKVEDAKPTGVLSQDEEAAFLAACDPWQFRLFFTLAFTGMRPGELCHLLVEDANFAARTMDIRNRPELGWKTKTRNERKVYLFDELLRVVEGATGGRVCGPLFLARQFAAGKDLPPLAGMNAHALSSELSARVADGANKSGPEWNRIAEERAGQKLWRDMGAVTPKEVRRWSRPLPSPTPGWADR
jgi:site-specific recombinase XerD